MIRTAVLVTGWRHWEDADAIYTRLSIYPEDTIVIHGGNSSYDPVRKKRFGADYLAHQAALDLRFRPHVYPYFSDAGARGGPLRNECMLGALVNMQRYGYDCYVEAFLHHDSKGTRHMISLVERHNKKTDRPFPLQITHAV